MGATSCVYDLDLVANVRRLANSAEDVELVLFETPELNNWPTPAELQELARLSQDYGLSYTVHIPSHMSGVNCDRDWEEWSYRTVERAITLFSSLQPLAYVWHWESEQFGVQPASDVSRWLAALERVAVRVAGIPGIDPASLAVETLSYPFELIEELVVDHGFSVTFDIGHLWRAGFDWEALWGRSKDRVKVVHLHGIDASGRDHCSLAHQPAAQIARFAAALQEFKCPDARVVTLEVFSPEDWDSSSRLWAEHYRG